MSRRTLAITLLGLVAPLFALAAELFVVAIVTSPIPPTPPETAVVFRGIAYPSSTVTVKRAEQTLVEVPADPAARFDIRLGNQAAGTATYTIFATDTQGRVGRSMSFELMITEGAVVTITGVFLGPTIQIDKTSLELGDTVTLLGATAPLSEVTVFIASGVEKTFSTNADADGLWTSQILADDVGVGDHNAHSKAVTPIGEVSDFSETVSFSVTAAPPDACDGKNRADLNCDGQVNLTDFSILMFYWQQRNPANARADINADGIVNLTDFSILLFNWTK